jgi:hypothetical protein
MTLIVSANGWEHKGWQGEFYPSDLPKEWRLDYYQSHFDAVWVSASLWCSLPLSVWESWSEEVSDHFSFYVEALEFPEDGRDEYLIGFSGQLGGVVDQRSKIKEFFDVLNGNVEIFHGNDFILCKVYGDCAVKEVGPFFQWLVKRYPDQTRVVVFMDIEAKILQQFKLLADLFS